MVGSGESGARTARRRTFGGVQAQQLALSHARGMASIATKGRRIVLLDLEGRDEGEVAGEEGAEGCEINADITKDEHGHAIAMDED